MFSIEDYLRRAPAEQVVCVPTGATKNMVLAAIIDGARSFEDIAKSVELTRDDDTRRNICILLEIYGPVYEMMKAGGGCKHHACS